MAAAVIFPGQGSQRVGMGRFYWQQFKTAQLLFEEASDTLKINFKKLCFEGPEAELKQTENTQPALVLVSVAGWRCLSEEMDTGVFKYTAGHSVGEYSSLCAAQVLPFKEVLKLVRKRGQLMKQALPPGRGGMSALTGTSPERAKAFCQWCLSQKDFKGPVEMASLNSYTQTVLSGSQEGLQWIQKHFKEYEGFAGKAFIRIRPLAVSGPFHSSMMKPAEQKMKEVLKPISFQPAKNMTVVHNTKVQALNSEEEIKTELARQISAPVLWLPSMEYLIKKEIKNFLEIGEGRVLGGLMRQISTSSKTFHFHSMEDIKTLKNLK